VEVEAVDMGKRSCRRPLRQSRYYRSKSSKCRSIPHGLQEKLLVRAWSHLSVDHASARDGVRCMCSVSSRFAAKHLCRGRCLLDWGTYMRLSCISASVEQQTSTFACVVVFPGGPPMFFEATSDSPHTKHFAPPVWTESLSCTLLRRNFT